MELLDSGLSQEDWQVLGSEFYSLRSLYSLEWDKDLALTRVFTGQHGGPMATVWDEAQVRLYIGSASRPDIHIYSAAGRQLGLVLWERGSVLAAGWSSAEELLVVEEEGTVHRYDVRGQESAPPFSLGKEAEEEGLQLARVFPAGVVGLTRRGALWVVPTLDRPRQLRLPLPAGANAPRADGGGPHAVGVRALAVLPTPAGQPVPSVPEVVVALDQTLVLVDGSRGVPRASAPTPGPVLHLEASLDGMHVAAFCEDGSIRVWAAEHLDVVTSLALADTASSLSEDLGMETPPDALPDALAWAGSRALVLSWEGVGLLLVGLGGAARWRAHPPGAGPRPALSPEPDGLRLAGGAAHWLLRAVPPAQRSVLEMGSLEPGALLFDARRLYEAGDARATAELLELVRAGTLPAAVAACLAAAAAELDPARQEALLRAACYGRAFLGIDPALPNAADVPGLGRRDALEVARSLRVLNALHDPEVGIPITMEQLEAEGWEPLVRRLVRRRHYHLALSVARAQGLPGEAVLSAWACDKVTACGGSLGDAELLAALKSKLDGAGGVEWANIASHAAGQGRPKLAALLLDMEHRAHQQVPLLLELGETEAALGKAETSLDADLMLDACSALWADVQRALATAPTPQQSVAAGQRFWTAMNRHPLACAVFLRYSAKQDPLVVTDVYEHTGHPERTAEVHLDAAMAAAKRGAGETAIQTELARSRDAYVRAQSKTRDTRFEAAQVTALARLREQQLELEASTSREGFLGLSVTGTIRQCHKLGLKDAAARFAREHKVPEKQAQLLALDAAAAQHDWVGLQAKVSRLDRYSLLTLEHYAHAAQAHGAPPEVLRWIVDRVSGDGAVARKAMLFSELGMQREAAALAPHLAQATPGQAEGGVLGSLRGALQSGVGGWVSRVAPVGLAGRG
ncbi:VPS16 [Auxenochlorella protothecoides x Auxenochlorella symbiontica]